MPVDPQYQVAPPTDYLPGSTHSPQPIPSQAGAEYGMGPAAATGDPAVEYAAAQPTPIPNDPTAKPYFTETNPYPVSDPAPAPSTLNATAAHGGINQGSGVPYEQGRSNLDVSRQQNARRIFTFQQEMSPTYPVSDPPVTAQAISPNRRGDLSNEMYGLVEQARERDPRYTVPDPSGAIAEPPAQQSGTPGTGRNLAAPYNPSVAHASDYLNTGGWQNATLPSGEALPVGQRDVLPQGVKDAGDWLGSINDDHYTLPGLSPIRGTVDPQIFDVVKGAIDHAPAPLPIPTIFDTDAAIARSIYEASPVGPQGAITGLLQAPGGFADFLYDHNYFPLPAPGGTVATPDQEAAKAAALAQLIGGQRPIPPITAAMKGGVATDAAVNEAGTTLDQGIRDAGAELRRRQGIAAGSAIRSQMTGGPTLAVPDISLPSLSLPIIPPVDQRAVDMLNTPLPTFGMGEPQSLWHQTTGSSPMDLGKELGRAARTEYDREAARYQMENAPANSLTRDPQYRIQDPPTTSGQGVQQQEPATPPSLPTPDPAMLGVNQGVPPPYDPLSSAYPVSDPSLGDQLGQWGGDRLNDVQGAFLEPLAGDYAVSPPSVRLPDLSLPTGGDVRALPDRLGTAIQGIQPPQVSLPGGMLGTTPTTTAGAPAFGWNAVRNALEGGTAANGPLAQVFAEEGAATPALNAGEQPRQRNVNGTMVDVIWQGETPVAVLDPETGARIGLTPEMTQADVDALFADVIARTPKATANDAASFTPVEYDTGVVFLTDAQGAFVGIKDPDTGARIPFPEGATDADIKAIELGVIERLKAKGTATTPSTAMPSATSDTAPTKTIGAEPDYSVNPPGVMEDLSEPTYASDGGYQGSYANDSSSTFSRDDYGYAYDARKGYGRSYDDDEGASDLTLEDFIKDHDGDGKISAKDRSLSKRAFLNAKRKRGKGKSGFDPLNRPESPLRTQILDELDAALPKGAPARRKTRGTR